MDFKFHLKLVEPQYDLPTQMVNINEHVAMNRDVTII